MGTRKTLIAVEEDLMNELYQLKKVGVTWSDVIRAIWEENKKLKAKISVRVLFLKDYDIFKAGEKVFINFELAKQLQKEGIVEILE